MTLNDSAGTLRAEAQLPAPVAPVGWPAWRLREAVAGGELGAAEIVELHLARVAEVEPTLNATTYIRTQEARREAELLQARLAAGQPPGPLCGVPITVKDVIATAGTPSACASAPFAGNLPAVDAAAVARLRAAGAIVIAKTNCPEFAFGITCESPTVGRTRNPWGDHSPGGSSGGEAALVAAGASAIGIGTDYGGSVRWPAACCGLIGLRPGVGSVDTAGQLPGRGGRLDGYPGTPTGPDSPQRRFQMVGPLARSVDDLTTAFAVMTGLVPPIPLPSLDGLRIGVVADLDGEQLVDEISAAMKVAAAELQAAGLAVIDTPGVLDGLHVAYNALRATDHYADLRAALEAHPGEIGDVAAEVLASAPQRAIDAREVSRITGELEALRYEVLRRLRDTPVLIAPVAPAPACDYDGRAAVGTAVLTGFELMAHCRAVTGLGLPALSIPVALHPSGLPLSVQVIAGPGQDALVLAVAAVLEQRLGGSRRPPWLN